MVCVISALLVARHQPYADPLCGHVQMLVLTQLAFTYMSGMLFFDDGGGQPPWGTASEESEERWGWLLVGFNLLIFALLGMQACNPSEVIILMLMITLIVELLEMQPRISRCNLASRDATSSFAYVQPGAVSLMSSA